MNYDGMADNVKSYFLEAFGTETEVKNVIASYELEGEKVVAMNGLFIPNDITAEELSTLKSLYSEYKIYVCMANDVLAKFRWDDFYKLMDVIKARKEERKKSGSYGDSDGNLPTAKGVMIFNE